MLTNNCECCGQSFSPYKVGPDEDVGAYGCEWPAIESGAIKQPKGMFQFCNPKSKLFNHRPDHHLTTCK